MEILVLVLGVLFLVGVFTPGTNSKTRRGEDDVCPECGGDGEVTVETEAGIEVRETCPLCQGSGQAEA